jgi:hypothetical protein
MKQKPLNCWEFKKCGRQPSGEKIAELGVCPATEEKSMDGIHRGDNGGRACWIIAGTFCGGKVQGTFANKLENCTNCEFFNLVMAEENTDLEESTILLEAMLIVSR